MERCVADGDAVGGILSQPGSDDVGGGGNVAWPLWLVHSLHFPKKKKLNVKGKKKKTVAWMTLVLKCVFDLLVRLNTNLRRAEKSLLLFFYGSRNCSKWYYSTLRWVEVCPWIKARSFSVCMCLCLSKDLSMSEGK